MRLTVDYPFSRNPLPRKKMVCFILTLDSLVARVNHALSFIFHLYIAADVHRRRTEMQRRPAENYRTDLYKFMHAAGMKYLKYTGTFPQCVFTMRSKEALYLRDNMLAPRGRNFLTKSL